MISTFKRQKNKKQPRKLFTIFMGIFS